MILVELHIQDYKQFSGNHVFTPSPQGIVAIIGHNGAGKTTLFEAIEWCLYQPREINSAEIPPRGRVAKPRVQLTLMDPDTGIRYVIQRSLNKQRVADAEIYRDDAPESRIVQGSKPTTEYVAKTLIGLSHRAFVSTFFTRQKELTFFGDMKETERRREVGRLLGMETIREAQKLIGDERSEAQSRAKALELQGREASAERDFDAEVSEADERISFAAKALAAAHTALTSSETAHLAARSEVERLQALERRDAELRTALARIDGEIGTANGQIDSIRAELGRMEEAARKRGDLSRVAAQTEPRRAAVQAHELARERYQHLARLQTDHDRAVATLGEIAADLQRTISSVPAGAPAGWSLNGASGTPSEQAARLLAIASNVDAEAIGLECSALTKASDLFASVEKSRAQLRHMKEHLTKLEAERTQLTTDGDPRQRRDGLTRKRDETLRAVEQAEATLATLETELTRLAPVLERLRAQEDGAICPTCGRPIEGNDIEITIGLFESRIASLAHKKTELSTIESVSAAEALEIGKQIKALDERVKSLDTLNGRIEDGGRLIAKSEQELNELEGDLGAHLAAFGLSGAPDTAVLDAANLRLSIARKVTGTVPLLRRLETTARTAAIDQGELGREIDAIGEVVYNPAAHESARAELKASEEAGARIAQIDVMLTARPQREAEVAALTSDLAGLATVRSGQAAERAELQFEPETLTAARAAEKTALAGERAARDDRSAAQNAHGDQVKAREALIAEHARIAAMIERAESESRKAGELDTMYREFNTFEQFVADHLTPQLSDYTGELLRAITEGKYDQVLFNGNYGIEVYDGEHEHFPVEEFSGGERDVIALCARLALSRLIGTQANNPPGFMVLDEVFGSLDRERRSQVLEALGALAGTADAYHQLFIISHVDDVRFSPIFNEVWRVAEGTDGVSHLENLNLTGGFEDA